jgi:hypothetical protein
LPASVAGVIVPAGERPSANFPARTEGFTAAAARAGSATLPARAAGFIVAAAGRPSTNLPANPADRCFRLRVSFAESASIFCATAAGLTPPEAAAADLVAFPANRTNCRYFSINCRHLAKSGSAAVIPATFACNEDRITLLRQALCGRDWPADLKDHITHFIDGFKILAENRNQLMHSNMAAVTEERIALYKSNRRDGKTILTQINLADLRQVADEMMAYYDYGLIISNVITLLSYPGGVASSRPIARHTTITP